MISETKLDPFFPNGQFHIHGFSEPYRFDRNSSGGGILLYFREDIPSKLILTEMTVEGFFVEIERWLLGCSYNPKKLLISEHLNEIDKYLDLLLSKYIFMLIGDLNAEPTEAAVSDFCEIYNLKHLIKNKICFKNPTKPTCIDYLIVTNRQKCFQDTVVFETGLSDFHKMRVAVMKIYYAKQKPSIVHYRKFKNFCNDSFIKVRNYFFFSIRVFFHRH